MTLEKLFSQNVDDKVDSKNGQNAHPSHAAHEKWSKNRPFWGRVVVFDVILILASVRTGVIFLYFDQVSAFPE